MARSDAKNFTDIYLWGHYMAESANARQEGGKHYRTGGLQHWDVVAMFGLDYFQGNITKYVFRWRDKGRLEDLKKARHYLDKYIEVEEAKEQKLLREEKEAGPEHACGFEERPNTGLR